MPRAEKKAQQLVSIAQKTRKHRGRFRSRCRNFVANFAHRRIERWHIRCVAHSTEQGCIE
jgi:hypothetical protein